jgi:hypothetical protein
MTRWTLCSAIAVAALIVGVGLAEPMAAQASGQALASAYTMTPKRFVASGGVATGLVGAVIGGLALTRSAGRAANSRRRGMAALVLGASAVAMGGVVVATADGGIGTGNGIAGGIVAIAVGLVGTSAGALALVRSRHTA